MEKITEDEMIEAYEDMLNETKDSWIQDYEGAYILKEVDPTAYDVGYSDYEDSVSDTTVIEGGDYDYTCDECGDDDADKDHVCDPKEKLVHKVDKIRGED